jgi:hypothetical protein
MMRIDKETIQSPQFIFIIYIIAASFLIITFRFIFPAESAPLPVFSRNWRLVLGALELFSLFPALVLSAQVIPFAFVTYENYRTGFSPQFFKRLVPPVIIAICAAVLYGFVFFLIMPLVQDAENNMRFKGELYRLAKERAQIHSDAGEWLEVSQFIGICDKVWPDSPELVSLRNAAVIHLEQARAGESRTRRVREETAGAAVSNLPGYRQPVNASQAVSMGETALGEGRFFDAHWLATVGERIAKGGSPEAAQARRLAARAWNQIESQFPSSREQRLYSIYNLKRSGYEAMVAGEWIRGYYIFKELLELTPDDPDAQKFFTACENGTLEVAFFIDEMTAFPGRNFANAIFSLPVTKDGQGRAVLRVLNLSAAPDSAYGIGIEYMQFDLQQRPVLRLRAPYAKFLPITLDGRHEVLVQMRALNRHDDALRWEPEQSADGETFIPMQNAQLRLDVSFENFLMLAHIRRGLPNMQLSELFSASKLFGAAGYIPEVFEAEIFNRFCSVLFLLPMAIIAIIIGWRFRARNNLRYIFIPMLLILPLVFNGVVQLYRSVFNTVGIWLIIALGFSGAIIVLAAGLAVFFVASLIVLAAQHG